MIEVAIMIGMIYGEDEVELESWADMYDYGIERANKRGLPVGGTDAVVTRLGEFAEAGAQRVILQWLDSKNLAKMERFAATVLPQLQGKSDINHVGAG